MSELEELVGFINHDNPVVKTVALQNLLGYSTTHKHVFRPQGLKPISDLVAVTKDKGETNEKIALSILVNVSDDENVRKYIIQDERTYIGFAIAKINDDSSNSALYSMLLANLSFDGSFRLDERQITVLLTKYVQNKPQHDYLSYVFVNYTNKLEGRNFFLEKDNLLSIIVFNDSDNEKRKEGGGKLLKNLLFSTENHLELIENSEIKFLIYILSPLMSSKYTFDDEEMFALPDELQFLDDKEVETNMDLVAVYLEALLLLCTTKPVRTILRKSGVYPVIRELHKNVTDEKVCELSEQLVQFLVRDEAPENESEAAKIVEEIEEDDSEDDQIIEVL